LKRELLERLRCPSSGELLTLQTADADEVTTGTLISASGQRFPVAGGIPRFVPPSNYADNFGMQWNHFRRTQLDSHSGHPISAERFWASTGWKSQDMKGQWVLDIGCGSGRFAEVALEAGAIVVAVDLSSAVDACYANLKHFESLHVVQASVYDLPFSPASFSFVYSLGVLQHTPDVAAAFRALPPLLGPGGRLCVDYYGKSWKSAITPKYWLRPFTKRLPKPMLFAALRTVVPFMLPVSRALGAVPGAGRQLKQLVPVADYHGELPLSEAQLQEWALLDTFDTLSPTFDHPQTAETARRWMETAGLRDIEVIKVGHIVARGRK
jgi:2-polyprenyl-3-methyl-5-hydroxy-6-metoxy-1,4-benzoquinol methylase/uncharacterized protein YbaR (Trm112 family)